MAARVWGGVAGWIAGLLPLVAANIADQYIEFDSHELLLLGAGVLVGGVLLGGVVSASIGGRVRRDGSGGASAAAVAGGVAAGLYVVTLIAVILSGRLVSSEPTLVAEHPIRASGVAVFIGALMMMVALGVGAVRGGHAAPAPTPGPIARPSASSRPATRAYPPQAAPTPRPASRPRPAWDDDDRYAGYDQRDGRPRPSGPREYSDMGRQRNRPDSGARVSPSRGPRQPGTDQWDRR
ncbi:MAG TPA: hypothetical protein VJN88_15200 [Ktedonobacterales bacterium]|nr:hypothetical protein [Ktedonobacterales bacterium]